MFKGDPTLTELELKYSHDFEDDDFTKTLVDTIEHIPIIGLAKAAVHGFQILGAKTEFDKEKFHFRAQRAAGRQLRRVTVAGGAIVGGVTCGKLGGGECMIAGAAAGAIVGGQLTDVVLPNRRSVIDELQDGKIVDALTVIVLDGVFGLSAAHAQHSTGWISVVKELLMFSIRKILEFSMLWQEAMGVNKPSLNQSTIDKLIIIGHLTLMAPKAITKTVDTFHELFDEYGPTKIAENDIEIEIKDEITNSKQEFMDGIRVCQREGGVGLAGASQPRVLSAAPTTKSPTICIFNNLNVVLVF